MKKMLTALVFGATAMLVVANASFAFTSWPNATCPDSVTIHQILSPGPCQPTAGAGVPGDTVHSVGGIITAFDAVPSSYAFYLQNNRADSTGYLAGIDVFTGPTNFNNVTYGWQLGDSVVVEYAGVEQYQGSWEMLSPNNSFSTPNIIVRKVSSGNRVPDPYVATTTQLQTNETNSSSIPYLCSLVRINGPLHVARKNVTGTNSFYLVADSAPGDSVFITGYALTTYGSPEVGTPVDWVQGVYEHRTSSHYAIWLRSGNDISVQTPPSVGDAYPIADNQIRVVFDRDVTAASATNTANYSLASFGSVDAAVMDGTAASIITVTNGLPHGANESVTCNSIAGLANGLAMTSPQSRAFINGVLTIRECQSPNADSLLAVPCLDRSRFAGGGGQISQGIPGTRMSYQATCAGVFGPLAYFMDDDRSITGDHGGLSVYGLANPPSVGRKFLIAGQLQEYYGETETYLPVYQVDKGAGTIAPPIPVTVRTASKDTCLASNANGGAGYIPPSAVLSGEDFEGMLVQLSYVKRVVRRDIPTRPGSGFHVAGESPVFADTMYVENLNGVLGGSTAADSLNPNYPAENEVLTITGIVHYTNNSFRVCPRTTADIIDHGTNVGVAPTQTALSFSVYPNPARRASLNFSLPTAGHVELGVYDVTGRKVASLWSGNMPAGQYSRAWGGRDASGKPVSSGVYFYRLKVDNEVRTVRGILLGH